MQKNLVNKFLKESVAEKHIHGVYLIFLTEIGCEGLWFEYHRKQKKITGGCGFPLTKKQLNDLDNIVNKEYHRILQEKRDAAAVCYPEYIDYEVVYGLDNGWN